MNQQYAGFGVRLVAMLIDIVILTVVGFIIGLILGIAGFGDQAQNMSINQGISLLINIAYFVFYQSSTGLTLGKKVMKIKVVTADGSKPSLGTFALREILGKLASSIILLIGYFMVLWDPKKQALHDKIAGTFVVKVGGAMQSAQQVQAPRPSVPAQPVTQAQS